MIYFQSFTRLDKGGHGLLPCNSDEFAASTRSWAESWQTLVCRQNWHTSKPNSNVTRIDSWRSLLPCNAGWDSNDVPTTTWSTCLSVHCTPVDGTIIISS